MCADTTDPYANRAAPRPAVARPAGGHAAQSAAVMSGSAVPGWRRASA